MNKTLLRKRAALGGLTTTLLAVTIPSALAEVDCTNPQNNDERLECLFPTQENLIEGSAKNEGASLSTGDIAEDFIPFFVNTGLAIAGTLIFVAFLYAGYLLVFANDSEENIEKGKKIMIYSIVGAVVMAIAYAVVFGIANLQLD